MSQEILLITHLVSDVLPVVRAALLCKSLPQGCPHTDDPEYPMFGSRFISYIEDWTHLSAIVFTSLIHSSLRAGLVITWERKVRTSARTTSCDLSSDPGAVAGRVGVQWPNNDLDLRLHPGGLLLVLALHSEGASSLAVETHVLGEALWKLW